MVRVRLRHQEKYFYDDEAEKELEIDELLIRIFMSFLLR